MRTAHANRGSLDRVSCPDSRRAKHLRHFFKAATRGSLDADGSPTDGPSPLRFGAVCNGPPPRHRASIHLHQGTIARPPRPAVRAGQTIATTLLLAPLVVAADPAPAKTPPPSLKYIWA